jgi:hypothetical protein
MWAVAMESSNEKVFVYQLRVRLREISPEIWRRILIRSDSTIADSHGMERLSSASIHHTW